MSTSVLDTLHYLDLNEEILQDPYPFFRRLRQEGPVQREPVYGAYIVSGYDEVVEVTRRTDVFSSLGAAFRPYYDLPVPLDELPAWRDEQPGFDRILLNDPPDHTRHRRVINRLFTPRRVALLEPRVRVLANDLIDEFVDDGAVELVSAYSNMLPRMVISELLGLPPSDARMLRDHFRQWVVRRTPSDDPKGDFHRQMTEPREEVMARVKFMTDYFREAVTERRRKPIVGEIMSELATTRFPDGAEVPLETIVSMILLLYIAGGESNTTELLTNVVLVLARHPHLQAQLGLEPALVEPFVEEVLRYEPPLQGLFRVALRDTSVGGVPIPKGSTVMILLASANRDERHFEQPEAFDLHRSTRQANLSFGHGPHFCPGAPLARLEGRVTTSEVLRRMRAIRLAEGQTSIPFLPAVLQRIPVTLQVEFEKVK